MLLTLFRLLAPAVQPRIVAPARTANVFISGTLHQN